MSERGTLVGAGAAHLGLIVALSLAWTHMERPVAPPPDAVAVDLTEIADTPKASAAPREATAPPVERVVEAAPPPPVARPAPPDPAPPPPPPPHAKPEPDPVADEPAPKPKPHKVKPPKPQPQPDVRDLSRSLDELLAKAPPRAAPRPRPRADPSQLASLLDKELGHATPARPATKPGPVQSAQPANAAIGPLAAATLAQSIAGQIYPCWNVPAGTEDMTVDLHIQLAKDGSLAAPPEVRGTTGGPNAAVQRAFADSAKRAVARCTPLKLPAGLYAEWHDLDPMHFDPRNVR